MKNKKNKNYKNVPIWPLMTISIEMHATIDDNLCRKQIYDNIDLLARNVHFGGRGHFTSPWLPWMQHKKHYYLGLIYHIPSHECPAFGVRCCLHSSLYLFFISPPIFRDCTQWMWTWFSRHIYFGVSVFIVQLNIHVYIYFSRKL